MKKTRFALGTWLAMTLSFAALPAIAAVEPYGSVEIGRAGASDAAGTRVPFAYDGSVPNHPVDSVGHGDGMRHQWRLGLKFTLPVFIEFESGDGVFAEKAQVGIDGAGGACKVEPALGLIIDCWNQANISQRVALRNTQLIAGWRFDVAARTRLSPYVGMRRVKFNDTRFVDYNFAGGFDNRISDESFFDDTGGVAGIRYSQDFNRFFIDAELQFARAHGDRSRAVSDVEYLSAGNQITETAASDLVEAITVSQRMAHVGIGKRFDFSGLPANISVGYQRARATGFDTRSTASLFYAPGELGSGNVEIRSEGLSLRFEVGD